MARKKLIALLCSTLQALSLVVLPAMVACAQPAAIPAPTPETYNGANLTPTPTPTPSKPSGAITMICHYGPRGGYDIWTRGIAKVLEKHVGVPVPVKHISGAGGVEGLETLWRAQPDSQTIEMVDASGPTVAQQLGRTSVDLQKLTWLGLVQVIPFALWVAEDSPFRSPEDLITTGKTKALRGGTTGLVSGLWQTTAIFATEGGIDVEVVTEFKPVSEQYMK